MTTRKLFGLFGHERCQDDRSVSFPCGHFVIAALSIAEVNKAEQIAPVVILTRATPRATFEDYVLVIDGNFPSGAQEIIPQDQGRHGQAVRFAFDTHHHDDHDYLVTWRSIHPM